MNKETIFSLLLACIVVFGGIALLSKSIKQIQNNTNGQTNIDRHRASAPIEQAPEIAPQTSQPKSSGINKCILAGKIIYSDTECAPGAKSVAVKIEESAGIISPDRAIVTATIERMAAENKRNRERNPAPVASLEIPKKISPYCDSYKSQIEQLDALAQQANSSYTMERIRQSRWNVQKSQLDGNCYKK